MLKKVLVVAALGAAVAAAPAAAETACYSVTVNVNGEAVVNEAGCV